MGIRVGLQDSPSKLEGVFWKVVIQGFSRSVLPRSFALPAFLQSLLEMLGAATVTASKQEGEPGVCAHMGPC